MPTAMWPSQVSAVTVTGGSGAISSRLGTVTTPAAITALTHHTTRPSLVNANADGTLNIKLPSVLTAVTLNSVDLTINGGVAESVEPVAGSLFLYQNVGLVIG